jgi:predicted nuclease of predicted toxin-antitoxin system
VRILLDECLPRKLAGALAGHEVETVPHAGWSGVKNGELLRLAATRFDALVTVDRRFAEGHAVPASLVLVTLAAQSNRLDALRPLIPALLEALMRAKKGERVRVGG